MAIFGQIISAYESAKVDNYFKPESRTKDYAFRIVEPEKTVYGLQVFIEEEIDGKVIKKPKRFLPENRKIAQTWGEKVQDFMALHIWLIEAKDCFVYTMTQAGLIKALIGIIKEIGEENLHRVTFLLNKQGQGFSDTKYSLSVVKDVEGEIMLSDLTPEMIACAKQKRVNMTALLFNERPWDNDSVYDLRTLDQSAKPCPSQLAKAVDSIPAHAKPASVKRGAVHA
jgi:hypothetical protein